MEESLLELVKGAPLAAVLGLFCWKFYELLKAQFETMNRREDGILSLILNRLEGCGRRDSAVDRKDGGSARIGAVFVLAFVAVTAVVAAAWPFVDPVLGKDWSRPRGSAAARIGVGQSVQVLSVLDGDTLRMRGVRAPWKLRLWGVDAPELRQPYGPAARRELLDLVNTATLTLRVRGEDQYGRTVGELVTGDGVSVGHELVARGAAWWYWEYAPAAGELRDAQEAAAAAGRGLWSEAEPMAPWRWRHGR